MKITLLAIGLAALSTLAAGSLRNTGTTNVPASIIPPANIMPPTKTGAKATSRSMASSSSSTQSSQEFSSVQVSIGTNLAIIIGSNSNTPAGSVSTVIATNTVANHSYQFGSSTNLDQPFTMLQPLWMGVGANASHTEKYTNSTAVEFFLVADTTLVLSNTPITASGGVSSGCPGLFSGYVVYAKSVGDGWGYMPDTNTTTHTAADGTGRTDTHVEMTGSNGDDYCGQTSASTPATKHPSSPVYRFAIYFPQGTPVPTGLYPILLSGFTTNKYSP